MPTRKPDVNGKDDPTGSSSLLGVLRQYLSKTPPKKKRKKSGEGVIRAGRAPHRKVYVKNIKVDVGPKKKTALKKIVKAPPKGKIPMAADESVVPEIEKSLQDYISRRSAYLNRAAGETAPVLSLQKKNPEAPKAVSNASAAPAQAPQPKVEAPDRLVGSLSEIPAPKYDDKTSLIIPDDELIPVKKVETIVAPMQSIVEEHITNTTVEVAPPKDAEETAATGGGFARLLRYIPFISSTVLETAQRTEALAEKMEKTETETRSIAQRIHEAETKMATWSAPPPAPVAAPAAPGMGAATVVPVQTIVVNKTVVNPVQTIKVGTAGAAAKPTVVTLHQGGTTVAAIQSAGAKSIEDPNAKPLDRKKILENEEKKAEVFMMNAAKKIGPKKAGFFAEFSASMQYLGMAKQRISMIQNLATMLNAGLPLIDALRTLQMETKNKSAKKLLRMIMLAVDNGSPLWRAMDDQHFFSPHAIALIRIGEEAGNLAQNMQYLADQQEKDQALKEKVQMAMIYPTIVMVLMFGIVVGLGTFVLPNLIGVLQSLNADLPLATIILIKFTQGFTTYGGVVIPGCVGFALLIAFLSKYTRFKVVTQWIIFKIPGIGKLAREATLARFGVILGGLLQAGVPLVEALRSLVEVTPTVAYKSFYRRLLDHVNGGDSFARSFTVIRGTTSILPVSIQQLIITGEKTGSLAQIMLKISDIYEKEANNTAQKLPVILEPIILLFIGLLVGTIAFAIIIPIYSIVGKVGK